MNIKKISNINILLNIKKKMSTTNFDRFIDQQEIPYTFINVYIDDEGKKKTTGDHNDWTVERVRKECEKQKKMDLSDKYMDIDEKKDGIVKRRLLKKCKSIRFKYASNWFVIDIDDATYTDIENVYKLKGFEFLRGLPYKRGTTKGFHIFIKINNLNSYRCETGVLNGVSGDLIKWKNNIWCYHNDNIQIFNYNDDNQYPEFDFNDIKGMFDLHKMGLSELKRERTLKRKKIEDHTDNDTENNCTSNEDTSKINRKDNKEKYEKHSIEYNLCETAIDYLDVSSRISNYQNWIRGGYIFINDFKDDDGFDLFLKFSERDLEKFSGEESLRDQWEIFKENIRKGVRESSIHIGTLFDWAKEDGEFDVIEAKNIYLKKPNRKTKGSINDILKKKSKEFLFENKKDDDSISTITASTLNTSQSLVDIDNVNNELMREIENRKEIVKNALEKINPSKIEFEDWLKIGFIIYNSIKPSNESAKVFKTWSTNKISSEKKMILNIVWKSLDNNIKIDYTDKYSPNFNAEMLNEFIKNDDEVDNKSKSSSKTVLSRIIGQENFDEQDFQLYNFIREMTTDIGYIAKYIYENKKNEFMFIVDNICNKCIISDNETNFYSFNNGRWSNHFEDFKAYISDDICDLLNESLTTLKEKMNKREYLYLESAVKNLKMPNSLNNIIRAYSLVKGVKKVMRNKFDSNKTLLGFNNGVLDLETNKFRGYRYDDYMKCTCGWDLQADENGDLIVDNDKTNELWEYLHSMFRTDEEKELLDYLLYMYASSLNGYTYRKMFIMTGRGANGKSLLNENHCAILGDYALENPNNSILFESSKSGANPELVSLKNKRFVRFSEPENNKSFNTGMIKTLTSGKDKHSARACYSNETTIEINLTLVVECNDKPEFPEDTDAASTRVDVIPFRYQFSNGTKIPIDYINVFPLCKKYTNKWFMERKQEWVNILLGYSTKVLEGTSSFDIPVPRIVLEESTKYLDKNKNTLEWFHSNYIQTSYIKKIKDVNTGIETKIVVILQLKDVYENFTSSELYRSIKRKYNKELPYRDFFKIFDKLPEYKQKHCIRDKIRGTNKKYRNILKGYELISDHNINNKVENVEEDEDFEEYDDLE